jgi:peptidoglycan/xylan/chitin deacetylase (PgdA/CDA1 family)
LLTTISLVASSNLARAAATPSSLQLYTSSITTHKIAALTFDDGPSPYSLQVLDVLRTYHVPATFFLVGVHVLEFPSVLRTEVADGNVLGNHTYDHVDLRLLSSSLARAELAQTQAVIRTATGVVPQWFRPPYDGVDARVVQLAASEGLYTVVWSVDPRDWTRPGAQAIIRGVLNDTRPGSVILLHDGGGDRSETVAALSVIVPTLLSRGYRFVTLDELFFPRRVGSCPRSP